MKDNKVVKTFVTFGQVHTHSVNGKTLDKDTVAVINHHEDLCGREIAFELFGGKFFTTYTGRSWDERYLEFYPKGYVTVM